MPTTSASRVEAGGSAGGWAELAGAIGAEGERTLGGLAGSGPSPGVAEIAQAVRAVLEALARRRPLVVVLDNLQWAEPTLLDLIEEAAQNRVASLV